MKIFIVLSLCIAVAWAETENLALREACNREDGDSSCQAGLSCVLTKKMIMGGQSKLIKQCMPNGAQIDVETLDYDHQDQTSPAFRAKRFLGILTRCLTGFECFPNFCCLLLVQRCLPKIPENGVCNLNVIHRCGCMNGLVCRKTTDVATPIPGINVPLEQCVRP